MSLFLSGQYCSLSKKIQSGGEDCELTGSEHMKGDIAFSVQINYLVSTKSLQLGSKYQMPKIGIHLNIKLFVSILNVSFHLFNHMTKNPVLANICKYLQNYVKLSSFCKILLTYHSRAI